MPLQIRENGDLGGIPVVRIVRRELIKPLQLPRICVQCNDGVAVKVVSGSKVAVRNRVRIARSPKRQVQIPVLSPGVPDTRTAGPPGLSGPCLDTRFTFARHSVKPPDFSPGRGIECRDKASDRPLASRNADDDFVFHDKRSVGDDVAHASGAGGISSVRDSSVPNELSVIRIDREQVRVQCSEEQLVAQHRQTAIRAASPSAGHSLGRR
jgi:hypothetical protein